MNNSVFTEGGSAKKVINRCAIYGKPWFAIMKHNTSVCVDSEEVTHVALL